MTCPTASTPAEASNWWITRQTIQIRGVEHVLRLVRFRKGWLASVDTADGPTLGWDHSPYLAVHRALEPEEVGLSEAMALVAGMESQLPSVRL